jgi:hypothetical protein
MSYTKGKLKECDGFAGLLQIDSKTILCVFPNDCQTSKDIKTRKANAKRAMQCWNNFDNLLEALKRDEALAEAAIASTPTGEAREKLTEINILRLQAISEAVQGE